ncbi:uncharacterized protein PG986_004627 [Apiospora aurea]|uniref:BTB domain-containing protein n=1 Tax=Apiospora aurea TaxID=335848 RepID=A0ABR1QN38_9PEZI
MGSTPRPCPFLPKGHDITTIDGDGDLLLKVGTTKCSAKLHSPDFDQCDHLHDVAQTFRVCSRAMARASPVWKRMLFGGFAESKPPKEGGDWTVTLPDDSPEPMLTVLGMVHARFDLIPQFKYGLYLHDVYDITIVTDKYDTTHLVRPWALAWLDTARRDMRNDFQSHLKLLWVSWVLGSQKLFVEAGGLLARYMRSGYSFKSDLIPPGVTERDTNCILTLASRND